MESSTPYRLELGLPGRPGWRGELWLLAAFALATVVLTWPIAFTLGQATGLRGDYFNNLWNAWWVKHSLGSGQSPYWTDYLYFPDGISLRRHTLSPLNSLSQVVLGVVLDAHQAFNVLLLAHFALSAWAFSLFARYVTGSLGGALLGGLAYSFAPFHGFYLCQINVFSFEFLPLGLLFFLRFHREGGAKNLVGVLLSLAGMTMSAEYYVVYAYLTVALLVLCARGWARDVPFGAGLKRTLLAGGLGAAAVALVAFPLLYATLGPERGMETGTAAFSFEKHRTNDLLGFYWLGPKEESIVSWPTMLGYSTLVLVLLGGRKVLRLWPWLVVGAFFFVLSLGESLTVNGQDTEVPLPYALFGYLPVLSMLRKSDRAFMMVQLVVPLLLSGAWGGIASWLRARAGRTLAACATAAGCALVTGELCAAPYGRFELPESPYLAELAAQPDVVAVMELPPARTHVANARFDYLQTRHGKKTMLGYTTALAVTPLHDQRILELVNAYWQFVAGRNRVLIRTASESGVQRIVHYKTFPLARPRIASIDLKTLWAPFFLVREALVRVRQVGEFQETSLDRSLEEVVRLTVPELAGQLPPGLGARPFLDVVREQFTRACGPPEYEDEYVLVFRVPKGP